MEHLSQSRVPSSPTLTICTLLSQCMLIVGYARPLIKTLTLWDWIKLLVDHSCNVGIDVS